jgi:hypothetical protein
LAGDCGYGVLISKRRNDMKYGTAILCSLLVFVPLHALGTSMAFASSEQAAPGNPEGPPKEKEMTRHPYVGMWVTDDGRIRHELLPNGRYDEARGTRKSAYQGRYVVTGNHIDYWDDTNFTADGEFVDENTLHHGGMIFRRR